MSDALETLRAILREKLPDDQVQALMAELMIASGNRAVAIGKDATEAVIITGNQNIVGDHNQFVINQGTDPEEIVEKLRSLLQERQQVDPQPSRKVQYKTILLTSFTITFLVGFVRWMGGIQGWELNLYDQFIRMRGDQGEDDRITIVEITGEDINYQKERKEDLGAEEDLKWSLSNDSLAILLEKLNSFQPKAIGLDLKRHDSFKEQDFNDPKNYQKLRYYFSQKNLFAVCKTRNNLENNNEDDRGYKAPPGVSLTQVGFNDAFYDSDDVLRRYLLAFKPESNSLCKSNISFSLLLAGFYLENPPHSQESIRYEYPLTSSKIFSEDGLCSGVRFSNGKIFDLFRPFFGGYQGEPNYGGCQILINYRSPQKPAERVSLKAVLEGTVSSEKIKDRIVLVGTNHGLTQPRDFWTTPYGSKENEQTRMAGVIVQAQVISQILDAISGKRSLIWVWPLWGEGIWMWVWSLAGALLVVRVRSPKLAVPAVFIMAGILYSVCIGLFFAGGWVPFLPALITLMGSSITVGVLAVNLQLKNRP